MDLAARTRIATAVMSREASDQARALVDLAAEQGRVGALVAAANELRRYALAVTDRAVLAERAAGATWDELSDALGMDRGDVIARYAAVYDRWVLAELDPQPATGERDALGLPSDTDPVGTAESLDTWRERHAEPWDGPLQHTLAALVV